MSTLDLIRTLRRAMTELRDASGPASVARIARALAHQLLTTADRYAEDGEETVSACAIEMAVAD